MATRAVSPRRLLTPLAVLVPIAGAAAFATWALSSKPPLAPAAIAVGLAGTFVAGRRTYGAWTAVIGALLAWTAGILFVPFWYILSINTSICGKNVEGEWKWLSATGGGLVFLVAGSVALRSGRAVFLMPVAFLLGILATLLLIAAVPGTTGFCET